MLVNSVHLTARCTLGRKCETFEALLSMQSACRSVVALVPTSRDILEACSSVGLPRAGRSRSAVPAGARGRARVGVRARVGGRARARARARARPRAKGQPGLRARAYLWRAVRRALPGSRFRLGLEAAGDSTAAVAGTVARGKARTWSGLGLGLG
eukprot:scaffold120075_cov63-Phaeocystis_antarctica.AAC.1